MKHLSDPKAQPSETLETPEASRRRVLQMLGVAGLAGLPSWSFGQPTASVNTTKLAVTDTEVTVGQLHSSTGTMAISETGSIRPSSSPSTRSMRWAASWAARSR